MIEAAAALALVSRAWDDLVIILVLLVANAIVGFWEEHQAGTAIAALQARLAVQARVRRDGAWRTIMARELVPGDVVRLRPGDVVPADVELAVGLLEVDQSALTGESLAVERGDGATAYSSSIIIRGEATGRVAATGTRTFFGRTAELVASAHTVSHFQRAVLAIGNFLIATALALAVVLEAVGLWRGEPALGTLQFALILTVAAIPVALPTVLSVTMAVGARRMAQRQAVVTRLSAMEELAGMDVLCSDKTGTLTQNRMTLGEPYVAAEATRAELYEAATLASRVENRDPIDLAILEGAPDRAPAGVAVLEYRPFDPTVKRTQATVRTADGTVSTVTKGAVQVVLELCALPSDERASADRAVAELARHGYRTLAVARTGPGGSWRFLGILALFDPLRPDAGAVVQEMRGLGVRVKLLTGDQLAIGTETARRLGLGTEFLSAERVRRSREERGALEEEIANADGFAQVFPEDKFTIVERLQASGHIVGMTGDGVNDAPALRQADVGIAVAGATDVARGAASVVLLTAGLQVLVDAVHESRRIFARMTSYAIYRVGETIRLLLFLALAILAFDLYPVTAIMIVLIAVLNDGAILTIAYDRAESAARPVRWAMGEVLAVATVLGAVGVGFSFLLLALALRVWFLPFPVVQTMIYLKLSVAGHLGIFAARTRGPFWASRPAGLLTAAVLGTQAVATGIAVSGLLWTPLPWIWVAVVWGFSLLDLVAFDLAKRALYAWLDRRTPADGRPRVRIVSERPAPWPLFYRRRFTSSHRPPRSHPIPGRERRAAAVEPRGGCQPPLDRSSRSFRSHVSRAWSAGSLAPASFAPRALGRRPGSEDRPTALAARARNRAGRSSPWVEHESPSTSNSWKRKVLAAPAGP